MHLNTASTLILSLTSTSLALTHSVPSYTNNHIHHIHARIAADLNLPTKDTIFPTPPPSISSLLPSGDDNIAACLTTSNAFCLYAAGTVPNCAATLPPQAQSWVSSVGNSVLRSLTAAPVAFVSALAEAFPPLAEVVSENPVLTGGTCAVTSVTSASVTATATPKSTPTNTATKTTKTTTTTASSATATATAKKNIAAGATKTPAVAAGLAGALVVAGLGFVAAL